MPDFSTLLMHPAAAPFLNRDAVTRLEGDYLVVETPFWEFTLNEHAVAVSALLAQADGIRPLAELAASVGLSSGLVGRLLEPLAEEGAVIDAGAPAAASNNRAFLDAFRLECRLMMRALTEHPFWQRVMSGAAPRSLILGWGIEFSHFVEGANEYMPIGVASVHDGAAVREMFAQHYAEEANHSAIFYDGLARCGLDPIRVAAAPPLATTRALINQLVEHALESPVAYAAGFAVMQPESEPLERERVRDFYDELRKIYPYATAMFDASERHACLDIELGHHETIFAKLSAMNGVPPWSRQRAVDAARAVSESFLLFFEGILEAYDRDGATVPRRPARL